MFSNPYYGYIGLPLNGKKSIFEQMLAFLDGKMTAPTSYGWFHILCLALVVVGCVIVFLKARNISDKQLDLVLLSVASALFLLEVYKQLNYSYDWESDSWGYQWYAFPFQFCSTPMYVLLLAGLTKGKFQEFLCSFLATFGLFAGLAVMVLPTTVFVETIGINIQTMLHHGLMIVIGVFMFVSGRSKLNYKTVFKGLSVFAILVVMAYIGNVLFHKFGNGETFNMFFISPYHNSELILLQDIQNVVPHFIFVGAYFIGFTLAAYIILLFAILISKLVNVKK